MDVSPTGWIILALSLVAAVIVDLAIARFGMEIFKPPSAYIFWIGRAGKVAAALAWVSFFTGYWYPEHVSKGQPVPGMIKAAGWAVIGVLLLLAFATLPRGAWRRSGSDA